MTTTVTYVVEMAVSKALLYSGDEDDTSAMRDHIALKLQQQAMDWARTHGYLLVEGSSTIELVFNHPTGDSTVRYEVRAAVRYDGVWGSVRAALAEDGLLPPADRSAALSARLGPLWGATVHADPPADPQPGDMHYDRETGQVRMWSSFAPSADSAGGWLDTGYGGDR